MITWDQTGTYEVSELQAQLQTADGDDWMTTLLQSRAFHSIPPANIQAIFMRMQRVTCTRRRRGHPPGRRRRLLLRHRERQLRRSRARRR